MTIPFVIERIEKSSVLLYNDYILKILGEELCQKARKNCLESQLPYVPC